MRTFETGATRDTDAGKPDYEGFLSPLVLERYGRYMAKHRVQADGSLRESDNWQKGIPPDTYIKSAWRHFMDWWMEHRGHLSREGLEDALCGVLFNAMGYLHEHLAKQPRECTQPAPEARVYPSPAKPTRFCSIHHLVLDKHGVCWMCRLVGPEEVPATCQS